MSTCIYKERGDQPHCGKATHAKSKHLCLAHDITLTRNLIQQSESEGDWEGVRLLKSDLQKLEAQS